MRERGSEAEKRRAHPECVSKQTAAWYSAGSIFQSPGGVFERAV